MVSTYHVLVCFLLGIVVPIVRKRHPGKFFFIRNLGLEMTTHCKHENFVHNFFFAIETREFSLSCLPRQTNMEEKANKSNCLLQHVRLLACLNFCGSNTNYFYFSMSAFLWVSAIVEASSTTSLSITSPPTHAPSFFSRLAGRVVDFIINPIKISLLCSFSFVMEHKWKPKYR